MQQPVADSTLAAHEMGSPQDLKKQVRITVETNLVATAGTNAAAPKPKSFHFETKWEGWNGLHTEISQKTPIQNPLTELRERLAGTNSYQVFHLEELKMSGKIGAKFAVDGAVFVTGHEFDNFDAGIELRRARLYGKGDCLLVLPVSYELEIGYIPNQFYIENSYLSFKGIPWIGEFKGGQFQPPMGLEVITSSRDISLMEAAAPVQALAPGTSAGIQIGRPVLDERATWKFGLFTEGVGTDFGDASRDYGRAIMRFTGLPIWAPGEDQSRQFLHLGLSANFLYSGNSTVRYRSRPESHLAPYVIDTGDISANAALTVGAEAAWVNGPLCVQAEYLHSFVDLEDYLNSNTGMTYSGMADFSGFYASASWLLTGESRPYDRQEACLARVVPKHNFNWFQGGWGAWELAARVSYVNLENSGVEGGRLAMLMSGINWYPHSHIKWRFDYGFGHVSDYHPNGNINIFQTRVEVDF